MYCHYPYKSNLSTKITLDTWILPTEATPKFPSPSSFFKGSMNIPKEYPIPSRVKVVMKQARTTNQPHPPSGSLN